MNRDPVLLVDEFLRSDEARLRRNGVVALGAITGPACTERLIEVALNDPDEQVREAAEKELTGLLRESDSELVGVYAKSEEPERKSRIYALAGRLRAKGAAITTFRAGIRSEFALFFAAYPNRGWKFYFRTLAAALGGALVALILLQITFGIVANLGGFSRGVNSVLITAPLFGAGFGVLIALLASIFATAYGFRVSRWMGLLVEILFAVAVTAVLYALLALLLILLSGTADIKILLKVAAVLFTAIAASRAFAIVAAGSGRSRMSNLFKGAVIGSTGAILVTTGVILLVFRNVAEMKSMAWALSFPACGALAAAFASVDSRIPIAVRPRTNRIVSRLLMLLISVAPLVLLVSLYAGRRATKGALAMLPIGATLHSRLPEQIVLIPSAPYRVRLDVKQRSVIFARANYDSLSLVDLAGTTLANERFGFERDLDPGKYDLYYVEATSDELSTGDALSKTADAFIRPFRSQSWKPAGRIKQSPLDPGRALSVRFVPPTSAKSAFSRAEEMVPTDTVATDTTMTTVTDTATDTAAAAEAAATERRSHAQARVATAVENAMQGRIAVALSDVREARKIDPNIAIDGVTWNNLCWQAAIRNQAADVVDEACEYAVALDPNNAERRDSRGLARALTGRRAGAIEDFNAFIGSTEDQARRLQRARWVKTLKADGDPFTPAELKTLMTQ